jgi:hypothetical protein
VYVDGRTLKQREVSAGKGLQGEKRSEGRRKKRLFLADVLLILSAPTRDRTHAGGRWARPLHARFLLSSSSDITCKKESDVKRGGGGEKAAEESG